MDVLSDAKRVAVFIDLENVGPAGSYFPGRVKWMLREIRNTLELRHVEMQSPWAAINFESLWRLHDRNGYRADLDAVFSEYNGFIQWTDLVADDVIISQINRRLKRGTLPDTVLLVTADNDFTPIVERLRAFKKRVIVLHPEHTQKSRGLRESADLTLSLDEFIDLPKLSPEPSS
ncbi:MAG: hypothetical protein JWM46_454 [Candidatus Kaiserbacteria bacterium]|nr:hypothetical protein [Candidatus Kaiserbacteria bacterium]